MKAVRNKGLILFMVIMMLSSILAACSSNNSGTNAGNGTTPAATNDGGENPAEVKDLGILKMVNMGAKPEIDMDKDYYPILDELTKPWGFKLRIDYVAWGEEGSTLQTKIAGGDLDLINTGVWGNYTDLALSNAFYDLNKVIDQAPKLIEKFGGKEELKKIEINGKLSYIPQFGGTTNTSANGATYRLDLAEKWDIGPITDLAKLEAYLYKAKEEFKRPMLYANNAEDFFLGLFTDHIADTSGGLQTKAVSSTQQDPFTAQFNYETPAYLEMLKLVKKWYDDGITDPDVMNTKADPAVMIQDGLLPIHLTNHFGAAKVNFIPQAVSKLNGGVADADAANPKGIKFGFFPYLTSEAKILTSNNINTTGIALGANVSDEEAAALIKFIEAAHTDKDFFDKYQYGKEGVSYMSFPSDTTVDYGTLPGETRMYRKISVGLTNGEMARIESIRYKVLETELKAIQDSLDTRIITNPLNGFLFDISKVENQVMAVNEVLAATKAIRAGITGGKSAEEALADMNKQLKDAGIQTIIDELNVQLKAFKEKIGA